MRKHWRAPAKSLVQEQLTECVRDVILAPDHVGYLHESVVNDDGKVVRRSAARSQQHWIADHLRIDADLTANDVVEHNRLVVRYAQPDGRRLSAIDACARLGT